MSVISLVQIQLNLHIELFNGVLLFVAILQVMSSSEHTALLSFFHVSFLMVDCQKLQQLCTSYSSILFPFSSYHRLCNIYCLTTINWPWLKQTIGQAYEEMQTQNLRLLKQITERDDYNTQVKNSISFNNILRMFFVCIKCTEVPGMFLFIYLLFCLQSKL